MAAITKLVLFGTEYDIGSVVDSDFSSTSTNPVQNKLVTKYKKPAIDIGTVSLIDNTTYYNCTIGNQALLDMAVLEDYEGYGLTFSSTINSQTAVFNVWQTNAQTVSSNEWIIFSGTYCYPDSTTQPGAQVCTVSINITLGALYVYPVNPSSATTPTTSDMIWFSDQSDHWKLKGATINALICNLPTWTAIPTDSTYLLRRDTGGSASYGQVQFLTVWKYISSKLGAAAAYSSTTTGKIEYIGRPSIVNEAVVFPYDTLIYRPANTTGKLVATRFSVSEKANMSYDSTEDAIKFTFE